MRLSIGKNHDKDTRPVENIFRLGGNDEDALTYALGFLLARDPEFCAKVVRLCGVRQDSQGVFETPTPFTCKRFTDRRFGRRDIAIQSSESANRPRSQDP